MDIALDLGFRILAGSVIYRRKTSRQAALGQEVCNNDEESHVLLTIDAVISRVYSVLTGLL
jgi:hypothetical protein